MKKLAGRITSIMLIVAFSITANAQTGLKLGHIDSQKLLKMMPGKDTIDAKLRAYEEELNNTIQTMYAEYQNKIATYQENVNAWSELLKSTKEKEIADLEKRISEFQQNVEYDFQAKRAELYQPLLNKAETAIKEVAEENGYTYILDSSMGTLLYFENGDDVMSLVKIKLGL